jgi:hypothetical protein
MKMTILDRMLLLCTGFLAAYQIVVGIDKLGAAPIIAYTIAFGVLLVAVLLLLILGFDVLASPIVVIVSTVIPLSLSLGLVWELLGSLRTPYLAFTLVGFLIVLITRTTPISGKLPTIILAIVHGIAGIIIFLLPIIIVFQRQANPAFGLVSLGGALIGTGGLLLSFLKAGKPILSKETIFKVLPGLLLIMTACFVAGFKLG